MIIPVSSLFVDILDLMCKIEGHIACQMSRSCSDYGLRSSSFHAASPLTPPGALVSGVWTNSVPSPLIYHMKSAPRNSSKLLGPSGIPMESTFELSTTMHLRGHELKLTKHRSKLEVRRHFFTERLVNRWNSLDHHTVNASTVNTFKNGLQRLKKSWMGFFED